VSDTLFALTINRSVYKEGVNNLISKIVVLKELSEVNLNDVSKLLGIMNVDTLNIFSINHNLASNVLNYTMADNGSYVTYTEVNIENFVMYLNSESNKFYTNNKYNLYILRGGCFLDIKNLFSSINNCQVNIGRGGSQKAHVLSPLDLRLSSYLLAMFNFDYKLISYLNIFNTLDKTRYLSYLDKSFKNKRSLNFTPISVDAFPKYYENGYLGNYWFCSNY
jgi:hypothetical protein